MRRQQWVRGGAVFVGALAISACGGKIQRDEADPVSSNGAGGDGARAGADAAGAGGDGARAGGGAAGAGGSLVGGAEGAGTGAVGAGGAGSAGVPSAGRGGDGAAARGGDGAAARGGDGAAGRGGDGAAGEAATCAEIEAAYFAAVDAALRCGAGPADTDCSEVRNLGLLCPLPMVINAANGAALAELDALSAAYHEAGCFVAVPCVTWPDRTPVLEGQQCSAEGRCLFVSNFGGGYCPSAEPDAATAERVACRADTDCPSMGEVTRCATHPFTFDSCGPMPMQECLADEDCGSDAVCVDGSCGSTFCADACPAAPCAETDDCIDGHCVAKGCEAAGAAPCPSRFACVPGDPGADARGCAPASCASGEPCPEGWDCLPGAEADPHGCRHRSCEADSGCDCGTCVFGYCEGSPGFCFPYEPPA